MSRGHPLDPFGPTASPHLYVPRVATERVLDRLALLVGAQGGGVVLFTGPPGFGKTQLLHVLKERLPNTAVPLYLPVLSLPIGDVCSYALSLLGIEDRGNPEAALLNRARAEASAGRRIVLLCDDACALGASAERLAALVAAAEGGLAAVWASDESKAAALRALLGGEGEEVSLRDPMNFAETARYVRVRLAMADVPAVLWRLFDSKALEHIHEEARGVPRCVNHAAEARMQEAVRRPSRGGARSRPERDATEPALATAVQSVPSDSMPRPRPTSVPSRRPPYRTRPVRRRQLRAVELALTALVAVFVLLLTVREQIPDLESRVLPATPVETRAVPQPSSPPTNASPPPETARAETGPPVEPNSGQSPPAVSSKPPAGTAPSREAASEPPAAAPAAAGDSVRVNVNAEPWARIEIDGQPVGVTPLAGVALAPGSHRFRARFGDGRTLERRVVIGPDKRFVHFP